MRPPTATRAGTKGSSTARQGCSFLSFSSWRLRRPVGALDPCGPPSLILFYPHTHTQTHIHTGKRGAHFLAVFGLGHGAGHPPARHQVGGGASPKPSSPGPVVPMFTTLWVSPRVGPRQRQVRDGAGLLNNPAQYVSGRFAGPQVTRHTIPHALHGVEPLTAASAIPVPPTGGTAPKTGRQGATSFTYPQEGGMAVGNALFGGPATLGEGTALDPRIRHSNVPGACAGL